MNFEEFQEIVKERASIRYNQMDVNVQEVIKNNGTVLHGFTMCPKDGSVSVSPTVYLENFFGYLQDGADLGDTVEKIFHTFDQHFDKMEDFNTSILADADYIRSHVYMTLVNKDRNTALLADCPHKDFYDLSVEYRILVDITEDSVGSYLVKNNILAVSGIKENELHDLAMQNTKELLGCSVRTMRDVLKELTGPNAAMFLPPEDDVMPLYIISNKENVNGAVNILYDETLSEVADKAGGDLVVLPSSIHEVICVPAASAGSAEEMQKLVQSVNAGWVVPEEQLSDNIYMYDAKEHLLSNVDTYEKNHSEEAGQKENNADEAYARPVRHR